MPFDRPALNPSFNPLALALAAWVAACVGFEGWSRETGDRIAWQHPTLELFLAGVSQAQDRERIELCVQPRPGLREGTTSVGFPRYRTGASRWFDGAIAGVDRTRTVRAWAASGPTCFSALVAPDATELGLPIGDRTVYLDLGGRPETLAPRAARAPRAEDPRDRVPLRREPEREPEPEPPPATRPAPAAPELVLAGEPLLEGATIPVPRDRIVSVRVRVRNVGNATARGVTAWIDPGSGVSTAQDGATHIDLGEMDPGASAEFAYRGYADRTAAAMSFQVKLMHAASAAGGSASIVSLPLADSNPPPPPSSDIDLVVPRASRKRPFALGVVLGVEAYSEAPPATFAVPDARTAARYFEHTLGIPQERIEMLLDGEVTLGQLQRIFGADGWLARRASVESEIFVFFAGHGMAAAESFAPYLLPADADPDYIHQTGFPVDRMIEMVAALGARRTTLFLDACFAGLSREGAALLDGARPLVIVPSEGETAGISVFSAGSGSQLANSLGEQGHGLFSYYLFKGLGGEADLDDDRRIDAAELERYLGEVVPPAAQTLDRKQVPSIALDDPGYLLVQLP